MSIIIREYSKELKYKILGFNDDQCECDVCGKQELKGTYAIEDLASGEIFRAGSTCGAKMAGWTTKELISKYKAGEKEKLETAKKEFRESKEYIEYNKAINFLNDEYDEVQRVLYKRLRDAGDDKQRDIISIEMRAKERTVRNRLDYLHPFTYALDSKRKELAVKHNLPIKTYLC